MFMNGQDVNILEYYNNLIDSETFMQFGLVLVEHVRICSPCIPDLFCSSLGLY